MIKFIGRLLFFFMLLLVFVCGLPEPTAAKTINMIPHWDDEIPMPNPDKGWYHHYYDNGLKKYLIKHDRDLLDIPGLDHLYLRLAWAYMEPQEGQYQWDVIDSVINQWTARGLGISFRISARETGTDPIQQQFATPQWVIEAGAKGGYYLKGKRVGPEGPWEPDFDDPIYLAKMENFLKTFAARYDGKPWLRYVDIGSIGDWGEGHTWSGSRTPYDYQQRLAHIDMYCRCFKHSQLVLTDDFVYEVKDPNERARMREVVKSRGITYRDDSILVDYYIGAYPDTYTVRSGEYFEEVYRQHPTVLELEHYRIVRQLGNWLGKPESSMAKHGKGQQGADFLREAVQRLHATYIGFHGYADVWLQENPELTEELLNRCGYWYFLHRVTVPDSLHVGQSQKLQLLWENRGVAPAYKAYQLSFCLEGQDTYTFTCPAGNRRWLPQASQPTYTEDYDIKLPISLASGTYALKLKMFSPQNQRDVLLALDPTLRDREGYYRIGSIEIVN